METRALRNPYADYDGSPALTQPLFDGQGQVTHPAASSRPNDVRLVMAHFLSSTQLTSEFAQRLSSKVNELLAAMENGLKSADPRDCTCYTGWAGDGT